MGGKQPNSYDEQKKAIEDGKISFDLNLYLIGENINQLYDNLEKAKNQENGSLFSYWNYYYIKGLYEDQIKNIQNIYDQKLKDCKNDPVKNKFKEVIIFQFKLKEEGKIDEIFENFCREKDCFCPFIIFLFEEEDSPGKGVEKIVPDSDAYYISPSKIFTIKYNKDEYFTNLKFYKILFRICSYYNELGDRIIIWPKDKEFPIEYNLIEGEFNSYINIFCLGRTGSGKSTFLNKFFNEKRSKEGGNGKSTTSKIVRFGIDQIPIRFYDIPGFEDSDKTVKMVNDKLCEKTEEMNNDRDKIHIILYFINYEIKTIFWDIDKKIIDTLKSNNKDVKIIFILTHCITDPNKKLKDKKKEKEITDKINSLINNVKCLFGDAYSYENNYFIKGAISQKNIILVNLMPNYELNIPEFGFDKIIKSIYDSLSYGVNKEDLINIYLKIKDKIANNTKDDIVLDEQIKNYMKKNDILKYSTFIIEKDKAIEEATNLYNSMFSYKQIFTSFFPIVKDFKMGINKYQKYNFKRELKRIFGFSINNDSFKDVKNDYFQMINKYIQEKEAEKANLNKNNYVQEIRDGYHKSEVNSGFIIANEVVGYASYAFLFNPVTFVLGGVGLVGSSYISYNQFKKDCTEYFEQYKNHYEEYKYESLNECINSLIISIDYFKNYLDDLNKNNN